MCDWLTTLFLPVLFQGDILAFLSLHRPTAAPLCHHHFPLRHFGDRHCHILPCHFGILNNQQKKDRPHQGGDLVRFMQKFAGHIEVCFHVWECQVRFCLHKLWSQICFLDCSDQKYNVDAWWQCYTLAQYLWDGLKIYPILIFFICLNKLDEYICQRILGRVMSSTRVLRSTILQWYHPPHTCICYRQDVNGENKKEGRKLRNQKRRGIQRKREANTIKKWGSVPTATKTDHPLDGLLQINFFAPHQSPAPVTHKNK